MANILIIDDSCLQREHLLGVLCRCDHQGMAVGTLADAESVLGEFVPDLALIELILFQQNGFQLGKALLDLGVKNVALMVARYQQTDEIWAQKLGIRRIIVRPISSVNLLEIIDSLLGETSLRVGNEFLPGVSKC